MTWHKSTAVVVLFDHCTVMYKIKNGAETICWTASYRMDLTGILWIVRYDGLHSLRVYHLIGELAPNSTNKQYTNVIQSRIHPKAGFWWLNCDVDVLQFRRFVSLLPLGTTTCAQVMAESLLESQSSDFRVTAWSNDHRSWFGNYFFIWWYADTCSTGWCWQLIFILVLLLFNWNCNWDWKYSKSLSIRIRTKSVRVVNVCEVSLAHHDVYHCVEWKFGNVRKTLVLISIGFPSCYKLWG